MWKTRIPALIVFLSFISFAGAENRAARLESSRWTAAAFARCSNAPPELEAGLGALLGDQLQAIADLDLVEGRDLFLASRAVGDTADPDSETVKKAGLDATIELRCRQGEGKIEWEGSLVIPSSGDTVRAASAQLPVRQAGQIPQQLITALLTRAREKKMVPTNLFTAADQSQLGRLVRPQYETLLAYGRARMAERVNSYVATQHLREALVIDPDFYPAYARLFYTYYVPQPNPYFAEADIASQTRVRLNSVEAIWIARAFYDLALTARDRGWPSETYHKRSLALLQSGGREKSLLSSLNFARIGESYMPTANRLAALYNIQTAREMMESQGIDQNIFYAINLIHLATLYSSEGKTDLAIWLIERARKFDGTSSLFAAFVRSNTGTILMKKGAPEVALEEFRAARAILRERECSHSLMYLMLMVAEANALRAAGDTRSAETLYNSVITRAKILGLEGSQVHVDALNGIGMTSLGRGDSVTGQSYLRMAYFFQMRIGPRFAGEFFSISQLPVRIPLGLVEEERQKVASYTGAFSYYAHTRSVQSRTYAGRLDDTNVLIKDLLDTSRTSNAALNDLRKSLLGSASRPTGEGVFFIDIGPAIANRTSPGVTAVSVARDFPGMTVIALDLPEQVELFRQYVHPALRSRVLDFPNFHVIAANGMSSLKDQFDESRRWFEPRKNRRAIQKGDPVIIRAANSIDIYETWPKHEEAMSRIAQDYFENPVLYFFNRTLLFKPARSSHFTITGTISKAGFDHMYETFDRGGESAYTLLEP